MIININQIILINNNNIIINYFYFALFILNINNNNKNKYNNLYKNKFIIINNINLLKYLINFLYIK